MQSEAAMQRTRFWRRMRAISGLASVLFIALSIMVTTSSLSTTLPGTLPVAATSTRPLPTRSGPNADISPADATALAIRREELETREAAIEATEAAINSMQAEGYSLDRQIEAANATIIAAYGGLGVSILTFFVSTFFAWRSAQKPSER